jgi:hypothetical protein
VARRRPTSVEERVAPARAGGRLALEHVGADEVPLRLDGAGAEAQAPDVAVGPLDRVLPRVAVAAEELHRLVAHELGGQVGSRLGHRRLERRRRAAGAGQVDGPGQQQAGGVELGRHVGDLPLQALQRGDRLAVHLPLVHVADGVLEGALGGAHAHGGVAAALVVQVGEQDLERLGVVGVPGDQHVLRFDAHAVEGDLGLGRAVQAHVVVGAGDRHALAVERHDHRPDPLGATAPRPPAPHERRRRRVPERRVVLVPVEPEATVAVVGQRRAHVLDGRAGVGLGDADADDGVAGGALRQPPLLERRVAEVLDAPGRAVEGQLRGDGGRDVDPGDLLEDDGGLDVAHPHPAEVLADRDAVEVGGGQRLAGPLRHLAGRVPRGGVRGDLAQRDVTGQLAQRLLVVVLGVRIPTGCVCHGPG